MFSGLRDQLWWSSDRQVDTRIFVAILIPIAIYLARILYRIYLHPLSKFPGPSGAAYSTRWLYNLSEQGDVEAKLQELHKKYGGSI
jgi:hypothetical protein